MPHYYLSPYEGAGTNLDPFRPVGAGLNYTCTPADDTNRFALVGQAVRNDTADTIYLGDGKDAPVSTALRRQVETRLGVTLTGTTVAGIVAEIVLARPGFRPDGGRSRVWLGGELHHDAPAAQGGAEFTDNFNVANTTAPPGWKVVTGDYDIIDQQFGVVGDLGDNYARYESDLASADHECEITVAGGDYTGVVVRANVPATDSGSNAQYYSARYQRAAGAWQIIKRLTGDAVTVVGSLTETAPTQPHQCRQTASGSTLTVYGGATTADTQKVQVTDTSIASGLRAGVYAAFNLTKIDNWRAADLAATPSITVTKTPTTNAVVTTGWTNPNNAHGDDGVYATAAPGKNVTINSDWGGFGFDSIPAGATINSVTVEVQWLVSTTASIATLGAQGYVAGAAVGTELVNTAEPLTETTETFTISGLTRDNLLDANFKVRVRATRGNNNTAVTASLDVIKVTVNYSGGDTSQTAAANALILALTRPAASTLAGAVTQAATTRTATVTAIAATTAATVTATAASPALALSTVTASTAPGAVSTTAPVPVLSLLHVAGLGSAGGISALPASLALALLVQAATGDASLRVTANSLILALSTPATTTAVGARAATAAALAVALGTQAASGAPGGTSAGIAALALGITPQAATRAVGGVSTAASTLALLLSTPAPNTIVGGVAQAATTRTLLLALQTATGLVEGGPIVVLASSLALALSPQAGLVVPGATSKTATTRSLMLSLPAPTVAASAMSGAASLSLAFSLPPAGRSAGATAAAPVTLVLGFTTPSPGRLVGAVTGSAGIVALALTPQGAIVFAGSPELDRTALAATLLLTLLAGDARGIVPVFMNAPATGSLVTMAVGDGGTPVPVSVETTGMPVAMDPTRAGTPVVS